MDNSINPTRSKPRIGERLGQWMIFVLLLGPVSLEAQSNGVLNENDVLEKVDQLDAPEVAKRREAERWLIDAGPAVLDFLPGDTSRRSQEARTRLERVRSTLREAKTESEVVDIKVYLDEAETLGDALEAISRDSGVEFEHNADDDDVITPLLRPVAFWFGLDSVLDQANLDVDFYGGGRETLLLRPRGAQRPSRVDSAAYAGVYRLEPTNVTMRRVLKNPTLSGLNVTLEIAWEPRITPIGLTVPVDRVTAKLDSGGSLLPQASSETIDIATASDIAFNEFFLPFELPTGSADRIDRLSGVLQALLPGKRARFELPLVGTEIIGGNTPEVTHDAMTVKLEENRPNRGLREIRLSVTLDNAGRALESHRQWIFNNEVFVVDASGNRIDHLGYDIYRQTRDGVGISYRFDLGDSMEGKTVRYVSPTAVVRSEVPFLLTDIELP